MSAPIAETLRNLEALSARYPGLDVELARGHLANSPLDEARDYAHELNCAAQHLERALEIAQSMNRHRRPTVITGGRS